MFLTPRLLAVFGRKTQGKDYKCGWRGSRQEKRYPPTRVLHCGDGGGGRFRYGAVPWRWGGPEVPTDGHEHGNTFFLLMLSFFSRLLFDFCEINFQHFHFATASVFSQVFNMFHHRSLGIRINIRVTKLVLLHSRPVSQALYLYEQNYLYITKCYLIYFKIMWK